MYTTLLVLLMPSTWLTADPICCTKDNSEPCTAGLDKTHFPNEEWENQGIENQVVHVTIIGIGITGIFGETVLVGAEQRALTSRICHCMKEVSNGDTISGDMSAG